MTNCKQCMYVIMVGYLKLQSIFQVYATGTEDMDALTFGSTVLLRHLTFSEARFVSPRFT